MIINPAQLSSQNPMIGMVVDRSDPQMRGRIRVRWFGYYSDEIPDDEIPWTIPIQPINSAASGGVGTAPVGPMIGTFVYGSFIDEDQQIAIAYGTIGLVEGAGYFGDTSGGVVNSYGVDDSASPYDGPSNANFTGSGPRWFQAARGELGVKEIKGGRHNPRVLEYHATNGFSDDETPWCSSFAKWCFKQAGLSTSGVNGLARSWTRASCVEKISKPLKGCIVVFSRPPNPGSGHVAFLDSIQGGRLMVLGGNQSNKVNIAGYASSRLVGFYWPVGQSKEGFGLS